jgi:predicted nucleotidyltransferase
VRAGHEASSWARECIFHERAGHDTGRAKLNKGNITSHHQMVKRSSRRTPRGPSPQVEAALSRIVKVLRDEYRPQSIILFGSHAYGAPTRGSDIDLLIIKRTRKPFHERYAEVSGIIRDVRRGWAVSTFVLTPSELRQRLRAGDQFFIDIVSRGRVLHGAEGIPATG